MLTTGEAIAAYGRLWMEYDLAERSIYETFSERLNASIRGEIVDASQPKTSADGPGMRYRYGRAPDIRPWRHLSLQLRDSPTVADLLAGKCRPLSLHEADRNQHGEVWYLVRQQIGTAAEPREIEYRMRAHRPLPMQGVVKRWYLVVSEGKRVCIPLIEADHGKPTGSGKFGYRLSWTVRAEGIEVCRFFGEHVNESLIVPHHIIALRLALKEARAKCDATANKLLAEKGSPTNGMKRQGYEALSDYVAEHPLDNAAENLLYDLNRQLRRAKKVSQRATRCIEKIYETAAFRVCSRHAELAPHKIDLARIKRYDTRDLLRDDVLPPPSRETLFAVAPGKLKALLDGYGLASGEVVEPLPGDARETDLIRSYVRSIGGKYGRTRREKAGHSQTES
jgi:hypothetical protein